MLAVMGLVAIALPQRAIAHGASIDYRETSAIEIQAVYDSGEPLASAQVSVFAPDDPAEPWLTGMTDDQGRFTFTPDRAIAGSWDVQVRQAGHGDIVSIPLDSASGSSTLVSTGFQSSNAISPLQKLVMAASVVWGCVGTALFFSSRSKNHAHS
jgi:nickel transport protein